MKRKELIIKGSIYFTLSFFLISLVVIFPKSADPIRRVSPFIVLIFFTSRIYKSLNL